jgi:ZU5 domain
MLFFPTGISLTIPQGAVPHGETFDIYLAVSRDDKDRPKLTGCKSYQPCFCIDIALAFINVHRLPSF